MERLILLVIVFLLLCSTGNAAEVAVVQQAARTTTGTQDFTSSGFGTPKGAMCMVGAGSINGTAVSHALFSIGFTDGTRQNALSLRSKSGVTTTLTGRRADTTDFLILVNQDQNVVMRVQFSSWITDGMRLNYSVAPTTAYQVSCTLYGGAGISNAYVNTVTTPATVDTGTIVSTVGFQPDVIIAAINGDGTYNDTNQAQADASVGFMLCGSSNPHTQKSVSWFDVNGLTTTSIVGMNLSSRVGRSSNSTQRVEIQDCTSSGFTAMTRTASASATMGYLALKLNGISASIVAVDSPTATGAQTITGITGIPQWGMLISSAVQSVDTVITDGDAEVFGVSSFTSSAQSCLAITSADAVTTTVSESLTDSKPVCLRKGGAAFYSASFTSFGSGTATFNYATANGTIRKWNGLFLQDSTTATLRRRGAVILP